ncbi:glycosyltransferase family 4 protein [bacterium]|nr:glycosyltransferase family 4 protein [candidate division CSSED10-310 bacterium]
MSRIGMLTLHLRRGYGVDLVVDSSARQLVRYGHEVTVYTTEAEPQYEHATYRIVRLATDAPFSRAFLDDCQRLLSTASIDAWIIHSPPFDRAPLHAPVPLLYWEHGTPPGSFFPAATGDLLDWTTWYRRHRVYDRPGVAVAAISKSILAGLPPRLGARVVYNGVDHYPLCPPEEARATRRRLAIPDDAFMVLMVGRFQLENDPQPYKGGDLALGMVERWHQREARIQPVVAGLISPGTADRFIRAGVLVVDRAPPELLPRLYAAADLYLSLSRWEGFNLPLGEAQYQGTCCAAFRCGPHPELVQHGAGGWLAETPEELAGFVEAAAAAPERSAAMGREAAQRMREFSWHRHGKALHGMLDALLAQSRTGRDISRRGSLPVMARMQYRTEMFAWYLLKRGPRGLLRLIAGRRRSAAVHQNAERRPDHDSQF